MKDGTATALGQPRHDRQTRIDDATDALARLPCGDFASVVLAVTEARPDLTDGDLETLSNKIGRMPHKRKLRTTA